MVTNVQGNLLFGIESRLPSERASEGGLTLLGELGRVCMYVCMYVCSSRPTAWGSTGPAYVCI